VFRRLFLCDANQLESLREISLETEPQCLIGESLSFDKAS